MSRVASTQPGHVTGHVGGRYLADLGTTGIGQCRRIPAQIAPVGGKGVDGQPALDGKMIEIPADRRVG